MHSEYADGLILRPMMDAGYTAWRDGRRVGVVEYADGCIEAEAVDDLVRHVLVQRLSADLRAAGLLGPQVRPCEQPAESAA